MFEVSTAAFALSSVTPVNSLDLIHVCERSQRNEKIRTVAAIFPNRQKPRRQSRSDSRFPCVKSLLTLVYGGFLTTLADSADEGRVFAEFSENANRFVKLARSQKLERCQTIAA